jgi:hypothetical protein
MMRRNMRRRRAKSQRLIRWIEPEPLIAYADATEADDELARFVIASHAPTRRQLT